MFGTIFRNWCVKTMEKEILKYIQAIEGQGSEELGMLLAFAFHIKNNMILNHGIDMMDPLLATTTNPGIQLNMNQFIKLSQKNDELQDAAAGMIWLHTIRAITTPEIRIHGRKMWKSLQRGMSHVNEQAAILEEMFGKKIFLNFKERKYPIGLEPEII